MQIGFVGTGNMGRPMATNMLKAGHQLTVFDTSQAATAPLETLGAIRAADLPLVAKAAPVTFMSLPNDAIVEAVLFGGDGHPGWWMARPVDTSCLISARSVQRVRGGMPRGPPSMACD